MLQTLTFDSTITDAARVTAFNAAATGGASIDAILAGDDTIAVSASDTNTIDGGAGTDTVTFQDISPRLSTSIFSAGTVTGGAGTRTIANVERLIGSGATTADHLTGTTGNDYLDGGIDNTRDTLTGGDGDDTYDLRDATGAIVDAIINSSGTDTILSSVDRDLSNIIAAIENVTLAAGAGDLNAYGSTLNALNNTLTGNEGANILDGRDGSDTLVGGAGDDIYYVRNYTDSNTGTVYTDTIVEAEFDAATGLISQGNDTVIVNSSFTLAAGVSVEVMETTSTSSTGGWAMVGNEFVQPITGNNGNNTLDGGVDAVDPTIDDGVVDTLTGGGGNDTYVLYGSTGATLDTVVEVASEGSDTISSTITRDLADFTEIENITLTGTIDGDATGNDAGNVLIGNDAVNVLNGKVGTDQLTGGAAADTFVWDGNGRDVVNDFSVADVDLVSLADMNISEYSTLQALAFARPRARFFAR